MMRAQKGQTYFFDCDRSKLPDFVHDFLPRKSEQFVECQILTQLTYSESHHDTDAPKTND